MQYEIKGGNLPVVVCSLESGEQMITESGGMSWMSVNMKMETTSNGGVGASLAPLQKLITIYLLLHIITIRGDCYGIYNKVSYIGNDNSDFNIFA